MSNLTEEDKKVFHCEKCFFYDLEEKVCAERHTTPKEGEKCYSFTPHVAIDFSFDDKVENEGSSGKLKKCKNNAFA